MWTIEAFDSSERCVGTLELPHLTTAVLAAELGWTNFDYAEEITADQVRVLLGEASDGDLIADGRSYYLEYLLDA